MKRGPDSNITIILFKVHGETPSCGQLNQASLARGKWRAHVENKAKPGFVKGMGLAGCKQQGASLQRQMEGYHLRN